MFQEAEWLPSVGVVEVKAVVEGSAGKTQAPDHLHMNYLG